MEFFQVIGIIIGAMRSIKIGRHGFNPQKLYTLFGGEDALYTGAS